MRNKSIKINSLKKNKKAVSEVVGYAILIVMVIAISAGVYQFLRTYIPQQSAECPDGVALVVSSVSCDNLGGKNLYLTLQNKGRYSVIGYQIGATNDSQKQIASINLVPEEPGYVFIGTDEGSLAPGAKTLEEQFSIGAYNKLYKIEIVPRMLVTLNGKTEIAYCTNAKVTQDLTNIPNC